MGLFDFLSARFGMGAPAAPPSGPANPMANAAPTGVVASVRPPTPFELTNARLNAAAQGPSAYYEYMSGKPFGVHSLLNPYETKAIFHQYGSDLANADARGQGLTAQQYKDFGGQAPLPPGYSQTQEVRLQGPGRPITGIPAKVPDNSPIVVNGMVGPRPQGPAPEPRMIENPDRQESVFPTGERTTYDNTRVLPNVYGVDLENRFKRQNYEALYGVKPQTSTQYKAQLYDQYADLATKANAGVPLTPEEAGQKDLFERMYLQPKAYAPDDVRKLNMESQIRQRDTLLPGQVLENQAQTRQANAAANLASTRAAELGKTVEDRLALIKAQTDNAQSRANFYKDPDNLKKIQAIFKDLQQMRTRGMIDDETHAGVTQGLMEQLGVPFDLYQSDPGVLGRLFGQKPKSNLKQAPGSRPLAVPPQPLPQGVPAPQAPAMLAPPGSIDVAPPSAAPSKPTGPAPSKEAPKDFSNVFNDTRPAKDRVKDPITDVRELPDGSVKAKTKSGKFLDAPKKGKK